MSDEETATTAESVDVEITPEAAPEAAPTEEISETVDKADAEETAEVEEKPEKIKVDPKQRKIAKQARDLRELKRQNAQLLRLSEDQAKSVQASQKQDKAPKIEDFDSMDAFLDARDEYRDSKREAKAEKPSEPKANYSDDQEELMANGQDKYEDFEDVVFNQDVRITPAMADTIFDMDDPNLQVDIAYYLGQNPKESAKISRLSERRQIAAIAKLEMKVEAKPAAKKQVSKAPAPIKPVGGSNTSNNEIKPTMGYDDFMKARNKQLGRK